jgi:hypothetical protein
MMGNFARALRRQSEAHLPSDPRLVRFARGLAIGALIGAAIAGSTFWMRRRERD